MKQALPFYVIAAIAQLYVNLRLTIIVTRLDRRVTQLEQHNHLGDPIGDDPGDIGTVRGY